MAGARHFAYTGVVLARRARLTHYRMLPHPHHKMRCEAYLENHLGPLNAITDDSGRRRLSYARIKLHKMLKIPVPARDTQSVVVVVIRIVPTELSVHDEAAV